MYGQFIARRSLFPEPHHRGAGGGYGHRADRPVSVAVLRLLDGVEVERLMLRCHGARDRKAEVRGEHQAGMQEPAGAPRWIIAGIPEIPRARDGVDAEQGTDAERDTRVRWLDPRRGTRVVDQVLPERILRGEQRQHGIAAVAVDGQPRVVLVAVRHGMTPPHRGRVDGYACG